MRPQGGYLAACRAIHVGSTNGIIMVQECERGLPFIFVIVQGCLFLLTLLPRTSHDCACILVVLVLSPYCCVWCVLSWNNEMLPWSVQRARVDVAVATPI